MNTPEATPDIDPQLQIQQLLQEVASLKHQLSWFKRQLFGEKSEKRLPLANPDQIDLGELFEKPTVEPAPPTETITYKRRKKQRKDDCVTDQGLRFDERVPVKVIDLPAPELQGPDADQYDVIDYKITRRLAQRPGSYVVLEYRRPVTKHKPSQALNTIPAPAGLFDRSVADVSLIAGMLIDKFLYHLPLHRQHQRMAMAGVTLSRSTLTQLVRRSIELLKPIQAVLLNSVLESHVLAMDETPVKAGRKVKGKMQKAWFWPVYGALDEAAFTFSVTRSTRHIEPLLKGFKGILLTDGYGVYDSYCKKHPEVTLAQCWTHSRRYFVKAQEIEPESTAVALEYIGQLYRIEKTIRDSECTAEQKQDVRRERSEPIVNAFFEWCHRERQRPDLVKTNPLSVALGYAENHREQMKVYLLNPDVPMDTNHVERLLRCIPMGRKNWMCVSRRRSYVVSCKAA